MRRSAFQPITAIAAVAIVTAIIEAAVTAIAIIAVIFVIPIAVVPVVVAVAGRSCAISIALDMPACNRASAVVRREDATTGWR